MSQTPKKPYRTPLAIGTGVLLAAMLAGQASAQIVVNDISEINLDDYLLPDMMPWISGENRNGYSHDWRINSSETEFAATTTPLNTGLGHLEVTDALSSHDNGTIVVHQTLYHKSGDTNLNVSVPVGTFVDHPTHGHFHFEGYAIQQLRHITAENGIGGVAASGEKISFCMIDLDQHTSGMPSNGYNNCGRGIQGISAGWGDIYSSGLEGQQIDLTGLERSNGDFVGGLNGTGLYWFEITIDPENHMIESNNTNNSAYLMIDLNREGVELDDHLNRTVIPGLEDRTVVTTATRLNHGDYRFGEINWEGDTDIFVGEVVEGGLYRIQMEELQLHRGDMTVLDTNGSQVFYEDISETGQQLTAYTFRANGSGDYEFEIGEAVADFGNRDGSYLVHWELLAIAGDADQDGVVDIDDLDMLLATWGDTVTAGTAGDFDADGVIGAGDLAIVQANWGATLADYGVAVPEPGSLALLALGGLALGRRRR